MNPLACARCLSHELAGRGRVRQRGHRPANCVLCVGFSFNSHRLSPTSRPLLHAPLARTEQRIVSRLLRQYSESLSAPACLSLPQPYLKTRCAKFAWSPLNAWIGRHIMAGSKPGVAWAEIDHLLSSRPGCFFRPRQGKRGLPERGRWPQCGRRTLDPEAGRHYRSRNTITQIISRYRLLPDEHSMARQLSCADLSKQSRVAAIRETVGGARYENTPQLLVCRRVGE